MPVVEGSLVLVTDRPESVTEAVVRAPDTRAWGNGLVTGSPDRVAVEGGVFRAELCPGPCVVTLLSMGVPVDYVRLVVPDSDVSLRVAFEAALAADVGDRGVLERLAAEAAEAVAGASASASAAASSAASAGESARSAERSAEAAAASEVAAGDARTAAESAAGRSEKAAAASEDSAREGAGSAEAAKAASGTAVDAAGRAESAAQATSADREAAGTSAAAAAADADRAFAEAERARDIAGGDFAPTVHQHTVSDITDLQEISPTAAPNTIPLREMDTMIRVDAHKLPQYPGHLTNKRYVDDEVATLRGELEVLRDTPAFKGVELEAVRRASGLLFSGETKANLSIEPGNWGLKVEFPHPATPPYLLSANGFITPVDGYWKVRLQGFRESGEGVLSVKYFQPGGMFNDTFAGSETTDTGEIDVIGVLDNGGYPIFAGTKVWIEWDGDAAIGMNYSLTLENVKKEDLVG